MHSKGNEARKEVHILPLYSFKMSHYNNRKDKMNDFFFIFSKEEMLKPSKGTTGAAGFDLRAADRFEVPGWGRTMVSTGVSIKLPPGCYGRIAGRSSLALMGLTVLGGVVDEDYSGEIMVIIANLSEVNLIMEKGAKIAQLILEKYAKPITIHCSYELVHHQHAMERILAEVGKQQPTAQAQIRGTQGFGSTGIN